MASVKLAFFQIKLKNTWPLFSSLLLKKMDGFGLLELEDLFGEF